MNQITKFKEMEQEVFLVNPITKAEIEGILAVELGVKKCDFDAVNWEEILEHCKARIASHIKRTTLVDLLEEAMNDYYKATPFFILDKNWQ